MYDAMMRRMRPSASSRPRPQPSTPQLFDTTSRLVAPLASSARTSVIGTPLSPKPPTAMVAPFGMSATASAALVLCLSIAVPFHRRPHSELSSSSMLARVSRSTANASLDAGTPA